LLICTVNFKQQKMKKSIFSIAFLALVTFASAQITTNAGTFTKPDAGDTMFELQFMPNLQGSGMFSDSEVAYGAFMMRKFDSSTKAKRYMASLEVSDSGMDGADTSFDLLVGYGIENHFAGAERLSTYWGYQGGLAYANNAEGGDGSTVGVVAGLFLGAEYYFIPNVYIGTELGYNLGINAVSPDGGDGVTSWELGSGVTGFLRLGFKL